VITTAVEAAAFGVAGPAAAAAPSAQPLEAIQGGHRPAKLNAVDAGLNGKDDTLLANKPGPAGDAIKAQVKTVREAAKRAAVPR
jgi:hypothetical protein